MKRKRILLIIRHNWQLKLLAVGMAVFLWLYAGFIRNGKTVRARQSFSDRINNEVPVLHEK